MDEIEESQELVMQGIVTVHSQMRKLEVCSVPGTVFSALLNAQNSLVLA